MANNTKDKLIRDFYLHKIETHKLRISSDKNEYYSLLQDKLIEEIIELTSSDYKDINEYADVIEVLYSLAKFHNIDEEDIIIARSIKLAKLGSFSDKLVLIDAHSNSMSKAITSIQRHIKSSISKLKLMPMSHYISSIRSLFTK